jgi:hypothetical protein
MSTNKEVPFYSLQPFVPDPDAIFPLDAAAHLAHQPRHFVLVCCKRGLVSPSIDPDYGGFYFNAADIRTLQRIGYLHEDCGINLAGVHVILQLAGEVERLRGNLSCASGSSFAKLT